MKTLKPKIIDKDDNSAIKMKNDGNNLTLVASCEWVWKEKTASRLVQDGNYAQSTALILSTLLGLLLKLITNSEICAWRTAVTTKLKQS